MTASSSHGRAAKEESPLNTDGIGVKRTDTQGFAAAPAGFRSPPLVPAACLGTADTSFNEDLQGIRDAADCARGLLDALPLGVVALGAACWSCG